MRRNDVAVNEKRTNGGRKFNRRRLQFGLRAVLMLPILFAAAWWWVTWPDRTARKFARFLSAGDVQAAREMVVGPQPSDGFWTIVDAGFLEFDRPILNRRSHDEWVLARRTFEIRATWETHMSNLGEFVATRNVVHMKPAKASRPRWLLYVLHEGDVNDVASKLESLYATNKETRIIGVESKSGVLIRAPRNVHEEIQPLFLTFDRKKLLGQLDATK